jgi:hypothetical protein
LALYDAGLGGPLAPEDLAGTKEGFHIEAVRRHLPDDALKGSSLTF